MSANNQQQADPNPPQGGEQTPSPAGALNEYGFDNNEAALFESMRTGSELPDDVAQALTKQPDAPPAGDVQPPEPGADDAAGKKPAAAAPAPGADDEEDDGLDEVVDQPDGQQTKYPKRVAYSKHKRILDKKESELKELRDKLAEVDRNNAKVNERLAILNEALRTPPAAQGQQQQQDDDPRPPADDVFGTIEWLGRQNEKLAKRVTDLQSGIQTKDQQTTERTQMDQFYLQDAAAFRQAQPDFMEAYNWLWNLRDNQLAMLGYADVEARRAAIRDEEAGIVKFAMEESRKSGKPVSAAKLIHDLAKSMGYAPKAPAAGAAAPQGGAQPPAGQQPPAAPGAKPSAAAAPGKPAAPGITEQVQRIRENQQRNLSLSDGQGAPPPTIDTAALASMSEEDFSHMIENLPRDRLMDLLGR